MKHNNFSMEKEAYEKRKAECEKILNNAIKVLGKTKAIIPLHLLNVDAYQRELRSHYKKIGKEWRMEFCDDLIVVYDEEHACFNIIDGQHRKMAASIANVNELLCDVRLGLTREEAAILFIGANEVKKSLSPYDTFKANQFIRENDSMMTESSKVIKELDHVIKEIADEFGCITVKSNQNKTDVLRSISDCRKITYGNESLSSLKEVKFDKMNLEKGRDAFRNTIKTVYDANWNKLEFGYDGDIVYGIGRLYLKYENNASAIYSKLVEYMRNHSKKMMEKEVDNFFIEKGYTVDDLKSSRRYFKSWFMENLVFGYYTKKNDKVS